MTMTITRSEHEKRLNPTMNATPFATKSQVRREIAIIAAVLLALIAVLVHLSLRESYWMDEGYTIRRVEADWRQVYYPFAVEPVTPVDPFDRREVFDHNPPFSFVLMRALAGPRPSPLVVRLFSMIPLLLALGMMADWARRVHGRAAGITMVLLGATSPFFIYYGHEARPYALGLALACATVWLAERLRGRPGWRFLAISAGCWAGCLTHFAFTWWAMALGAILGLQWLQARSEGETAEGRAALAGMLGTAAGAALAMTALAPQWGIFKHCQGASSWAMTPEVLATALGLPFSLMGQTPVAPGTGVALQGGLLAVMAWLWRGSARRRAGAVAMAAWLLPLALALIAKYWADMAFRERYAFGSVAGWLMALAWTAREAAGRRGAARLAAGAVLAAMLAVNLAWSARNLGKPMRFQMRPAAEYLKAHARPGDAYTVVPYCENPCFEANSGAVPPAGRYFAPGTPWPKDAAVIWVLAEAQLTLGLDRNLDPSQWQAEKVVTPPGIELFRITRRGAKE